eukprot:10895601-Karenia_brevis.AAC.1
MPSMYRISTEGVVTEAIPDVVLSFPGSLSLTALDVTVRCPHGERYEKAQEVAGTAAADGELEKHERYGKEVVPVSFETYGRLGSASQK